METANILATRYARGAIVMHWIIALLIILNIAAAWVSEDMPKPDRAMIMGNHKAIGILILVLTLVRIAWRLGHKPPPLVETLAAWEAALARVTHWLFYFLMLALPLTGWAMVSAGPRGGPVSIFGLFNVPALPAGAEQGSHEMFENMHGLLGNLMVALIALHVLGALKHQFVDHDGTLRRMIPWIR
ncbi:MAG: cytochrome b [Novosphingobium sp.]